MAKATPTQPPDYDALFEWLSSDRAEAEMKFHRIRSDLIRIAASRGCGVPEDLADDAIERVARKVHAIRAEYVGDPARYFHAVVRNVHREYSRRRELEGIEREPSVAPAADDTAERHARCLDRCLRTISGAEQALILDYYSQDRSDKIARRKAMAKEIGVGVNALRIRAYRIREKLFLCVTACLQSLAT